MKGNVEIFHGPSKIFEQKNLIVDGAFETIVDIFTHRPAPSSISSVTLNAVSSYTINALTLGPPSFSLVAHDSRFGLEKTHVDGTTHLWVTGADSGIHILRNNLPNRFLTEYGNAGQPSRSQESYFATMETKRPLDFILESKVGAGTVVRDDRELSVDKLNGQCEYVFKTPVNLQFGKDYKFDLSGFGQVDFALVSINERKEKKFFDFNTGRYTLYESYTTVFFDSVGIETVLTDNGYSPKDAQDVDGGTTSKYFIYLRLPKRDLYSYGMAGINWINVLPYDSLILNNPQFNRNVSMLRNTYFDLFDYETNVPTDIAKQFGFVKFKGWDKISNLEKSNNILADASAYGYVSLVEDFDGTYGVNLTASALTGIGAAQISQKFIPNFNSILLNIYNEKQGTFNPYLLFYFDVFQASANSLGINVEFKDLTTDEYFAFSGNTNTEARTWGTNLPYVVGTTHPLQYQRYSHLIPINGRLNHVFEVSLRGNGTTTGFADYTIKNLFLGAIEGWNQSYAPVASGAISYGSFEDGYCVSLSSVSGFNPVGKTYQQVVNYGANFAGLDPHKDYSIVIDALPLGTTPTKLGVLISHISPGNIDHYQSFNLMTLGGILKTTEPLNKNKSAYIGYLNYFNIGASPSAVASPYGSDRTSKIDYSTNERAVKFDGEFQTSSCKFFTPINAGKHTLSWEFFNQTKLEEEYVFGMYLKNVVDGDPNLWYNFETQEFVPFGNVNPITDANSTGEYERDLESDPSVDFFISSKELNNYIVDNDYAALTFVFYGKRNNAYETTFSGNTYFHDIKLTGEFKLLDSEKWFESNGRTPLAYYQGSGVWALSSVNESQLGALTQSTIPNSIIELTISANEQVTIPIYNLSSFNADFESRGFGLGTIQTGATPYSTYGISIFPISGAGVLLRKVALCDYALQGYGGEADIRDRGVPTSERNLPHIRKDFLDGWHIHTASSTSNSTPPRVSVTKFQENYGILYESLGNSPHAVVVSYSKRVGELNLIGDRFKYSFDHFGDASKNNTLKTGLLYQRNDKELIWDFSSNKFKPYLSGVFLSNNLSGITTVSSFPFNSSNTDYTTNYITSSITLPNERNDDDVITPFIFIDASAAYAQALITNLRFYSVISEFDSSSIFAEFPNPRDKALQTPLENFIGHFENHHEFINKEDEQFDDTEEALYHGSYLPAEGLEYFSGTTWVTGYGNLNQYGVITPNGFILEQKQTPRSAQTILNASAGMVISSINPSSTREVKYAITLTEREWYVLNKYYGGIGAIGLWAIDYIKTARKYGSDEGAYGPPFIVSGEATTFNSVNNGPPLPMAAPGSLTPEYRNSSCLQAKGKKKGNSVFHTNFGSPPGRVNRNGWAVSGDSYRLIFAYKTNSDYASIISDNFPEESLPKSDNWTTKTINFNASGTGFNTVLFKVREDTDPESTKTPIMRLDNMSLSSISVPNRFANYQFGNTSSVNNFKTNYPKQNDVDLSIVWDGSLYNSSLYTSSEIAEYEPIFKLFAKKVFFPGGLQITPSAENITIVWTVQF